VINFETVFDDLGQKLIDNVAVWATIVAFIVAYIPFAVLARHLDKKDALKVLHHLICCVLYKGMEKTGWWSVGLYIDISDLQTLRAAKKLNIKTNS